MDRKGHRISFQSHTSSPSDSLHVKGPTSPGHSHSLPFFLLSATQQVPNAGRKAEQLRGLVEGAFRFVFGVMESLLLQKTHDHMRLLSPVTLLAVS